MKWLLICVLLLKCVGVECEVTAASAADGTSVTPQWDPHGYVMFCLCMGRFGNQVDHLLGAMAFAKSLNRTLILPQFRIYHHYSFSHCFKYETIKKYHKVIEVEDFMEHLAPTHWPPGKRIAMCWLPPSSEANCKMKEGVPFKPYWDGLKIDFDRDEVFQIGFDNYSIPKWHELYPPEQYPVYAMRGAPASFPVHRDHRYLQQYLQFSQGIATVGEKYIQENFENKSFVGLHLRNGVDWQRACEHSEGASFMASPQCLEGTNKQVTKKLCLPPTAEILRLAKNVILQTRAKVIFVATDQYHLKKELENHLSAQKVAVFHMDPEFPLHDLYILTRADHFIGNCVSSFTSFVKRHRDVNNLPTSFFGLS